MPHKGKKGHRRNSLKTKEKKPSRALKLGIKTGGVNKTTIAKSSTPKLKNIANKNEGEKLTKKDIKSNLPENTKEIKANDARFRRKHGRIIIRNLPFQVNEDNLRKHLEKCGEIEEINILHKPDGKLVGCGFVQFSSKKSAQKAIEEFNAKPFLGRTIILDWAVPKEVFKANFKPLPKESEDAEENKQTDVVVVKEEKIDEEDFKEDGDDEEEDIDEGGESDDGSDSGSAELNSGERIGQNDRHKKNAYSSVQHKAFPRKTYYEEKEGCTVFLKNVSFQTTDEELKDFMETFGGVQYALICKDPLTGHSRGTAFVKFKDKESADKSLSASSEELSLDGSELSVYPALSRDDAKRKVEEEKQKTPKDARNLYLVKEGVVIAGSKAAKGVSVSDMAKRVKLDSWKTQMLKNLKMFVSRYRLVIHNLPLSYKDQHLRKLFLKNAGTDAVIKEAKVMRDLKKIDGTGLGQSKEYGFVSFTKHEDALMALRNINNNPDIFSPDKRPIVAFSIENKAIINAKKKRLLKSQAMNPVFQESKKRDALANGASPEKGCKGKIDKSEESLPHYVGLASKPGVTKIRLRHKHNNQIKVHTENVKKDKKKRKVLQQQSKILKVSDGKMQATQEKRLKKKSKVVEDASFLNLVNKYKKQLESAPKKWYENDAA